MDRFVITKGQRVLFIGDSITDAGRREDPDGMGAGYVFFIANWVTARYPDLKVEFMNRGIGGNTVPDLEARWDSDCLELRPDCVSIMVGINDAAQQARGVEGMTLDVYESGYRRLLDRVRGETAVRLVLMEPFLIGGRTNGQDWRPLVNQRIEVVHRLAGEYDAVLVAIDAAFAKACEHRPPESWAPDAVHPFPAGHALIAQQWLVAMGE